MRFKAARLTVVLPFQNENHVEMLQAKQKKIYWKYGIMIGLLAVALVGNLIGILQINKALSSLIISVSTLTNQVLLSLAPKVSG